MTQYQSPINPGESPPVKADGSKKFLNMSGGVLALTIAGVVVLCCIGPIVVLFAAGVLGSVTDSPTRASGPTISRPTQAVATREPAPVVEATPTIKDFKIAVKITRKACFGSAGCNVDYRIDPSYYGPDLSPDKTYEIVYQIKGGEEVMTNSFTLTGDTIEFEETGFASTKSSKSVLTAVVTEVNELLS